MKLEASQDAQRTNPAISSPSDEAFLATKRARAASVPVSRSLNGASEYRLALFSRYRVDCVEAMSPLTKGVDPIHPFKHFHHLMAKPNVVPHLTTEQLDLFCLQHSSFAVLRG